MSDSSEDPKRVIRLWIWEVASKDLLELVREYRLEESGSAL